MMTDTKITWGGLHYEAPTVTSLDILSEGLLCQSGFGEANEAGDLLKETNEWDF